MILFYTLWKRISFKFIITRLAPLQPIHPLCRDEQSEKWSENQFNIFKDVILRNFYGWGNYTKANAINVNINKL